MPCTWIDDLRHRIRAANGAQVMPEIQTSLSLTDS